MLRLLRMAERCAVQFARISGMSKPLHKPIMPLPAGFLIFFKKLRLPASMLLLVMLLSGVLFSFRGPITAHFPGLISSFNGIGLTIEPNLDVLKSVIYRQAIRVICCGFAARYIMRTALLPMPPRYSYRCWVQINRASTRKLIPDNKFIAAGQATDFFVQKEVESG